MSDPTHTYRNQPGTLKRPSAAERFTAQSKAQGADGAAEFPLPDEVNLPALCPHPKCLAQPCRGVVEHLCVVQGHRGTPHPALMRRRYSDDAPTLEDKYKHGEEVHLYRCSYLIGGASSTSIITRYTLAPNPSAALKATRLPKGDAVVVPFVVDGVKGVF